MRYALCGIALAAGLMLQAQHLETRLERSGAAATLVAKTAAARQAIAEQQRVEAQECVRQALAQADRLQKTDLAAAPLLVPIYTEFAAPLDGVSRPYVATTLNVTAARDQLQAADSALRLGDLRTADADLAVVQKAVTTRTYNGDLPLLQTRENLALARNRLLAGDNKDAGTALRAAARALDRFANQRPQPPQAKKAEEMRVVIDGCAEHLENHPDVADRITGWWDQVTQWFESGMAQ